MAWNKGLTKETDNRIRRDAEIHSKSIKGKKRKPLSEEHKKAVSNGMKEAHKNGKAWNIGQSRWNNQPSYPEIFFMKVIKNEFDDKNYNFEVPFHRFSLDFAWKHKKKVIEIDGQQHEKNEQKERDIKKNELLKEEGWEILRIQWKDMCSNTKKWITISNNFIGK